MGIVTEPAALSEAAGSAGAEHAEDDERTHGCRCPDQTPGSRVACGDEGVEQERDDDELQNEIDVEIVPSTAYELCYSSCSLHVAVPNRWISRGWWRYPGLCSGTAASEQLAAREEVAHALALVVDFDHCDFIG